MIVSIYAGPGNTVDGRLGRGYNVAAIGRGPGVSSAVGRLGGVASALALGVILFPPRAAADTLYLIDGQKVECKIDRVTEKEVVIRIKFGVVSVPTVRVEKIEYDYVSRLATLAPDDFRGRYEVGTLCEQEGRSAEAIACFEQVIGKPEVPLEAYLRLARLYEAAGRIDDAIAAYRKYLIEKPDDGDVKKKLAELTSSKAKGVGAGAQEPMGADEGLEAQDGWRPQAWGNQATVSIVTEPTEKNRYLAVSYTGNEKDKTAVGLGSRLDFSGKKKLSFTANNKGARPVDISIALVTTEFFESRLVSLPVGWSQNLYFDLTTKDYKAKSTSWAYNTDVKGLDRIGQVYILIYNVKPGEADSSGVIYFDKIKPE